MTDKLKALSSFPPRRLWGLIPAAALILLASLGPAGDAAVPLPQETSNPALAPHEKTFAALQDALRQNPDDVVSRVYLARLYIRAAEGLHGPVEKGIFYAMADLEASIALNLSPGLKNTRQLYGETSILTGNLSRAMRIYEDLVYEDTEGRNTEDQAILFGLYVLEQNIDRGILFFRTKLRRAPNQQEPRYLLALLHILAGDRRDAVSHLKVLTDSPATPENILLISQKLVLELDR
jgi:hypothetical protein